MRERTQTPILNVGSRLEFGSDVRTVKAIRSEKIRDQIGNEVIQPVVILDKGERITGKEIEKALGI